MEARIALLEPADWEFVYASLRNGTGLSVACEGMQLDVQAMSDFLRKSPKFLLKCQQEVKTGYKALMTIINNNAAEMNPSKWREGHRGLREFVKSVNLWEQHCPNDQCTPDRVAEAFYTYQFVGEVATVLGFTLADFYRYLLADTNLTSYCIQNGFING